MLKKLAAIAACVIALAACAAPPALASPQTQLEKYSAPAAIVADLVAPELAPAAKLEPIVTAAEKRDGKKEDQGSDGRRKGSSQASWSRGAPPHPLIL